MKVLFSLTYYSPYLSGLSLYAKRLAEGLSERNIRIDVLTSQFDRSLNKREKIDNISIFRVPYQLKFHKGLIMLTWIFEGYKRLKENDCLICHFPQVEAIWLLIIAKLLKKKSILVYQCDVVLPSGGINKIIEKLLTVFNDVSCKLADRIVSSSSDYAVNSSVLSKYLNKVKIIYPPIKDFSQLKLVESPEIKFIKSTLSKSKYKIGFVGRISSDKGVEYLLQAIPSLENEIDNFAVFLVGPEDSVGEEEYVKKIKKLALNYKKRVYFLGKISDESLAYFYKNIDVLVLPSINSTEAFGMVQVEAMSLGVPVVASDLSGVREVIKLTRMGEIVPQKRPDSIAGAIIKILKSPQSYKKKDKVKKIFSFKKTIDLYIEIFNEKKPF